MRKFFGAFAFMLGVGLTVGFGSCKVEEAEIEYVTNEVEKTYASAVTFVVSETDTEGTLSLIMASATEGAVIYYTADGSTPTAGSSKYTAALTVSADTTFKAIAVKTGMENSPLSTATVSIKEKKVNVEVDKKADETAPAAVTNIEAAAIGDSRVLLTWTDAADNDVFGYEVSYSGSGAINRAALSAMPENSMMVAQGNGGCYVSNLINGTEYTFTVKTVDTSGNKSEGVTAKATPTHLVPQVFVKVQGGTVTGKVSGGGYYANDNSKIFVDGRTVTIGNIYVSDHEVTIAEYEKYCTFKAKRDLWRTTDNCPAQCVSWYDAIVYCNLRSIDDGFNSVYAINGETNPANWPDIVSENTDGFTKYYGPSSNNDTWNGVSFDTTANGYRLPTEAEWEYVAREANTSATAYSGSKNINDVAWYDGNSDNIPQDVKSKKANSLGIYDMCGNVNEWCWDWYVSRITSTTPGIGPETGEERVLHGGSFYSSDNECVINYRGDKPPVYRNYSSGFRVVRNAE